MDTGDNTAPPLPEQLLPIPQEPMPVVMTVASTDPERNIPTSKDNVPGVPLDKAVDCDGPAVAAPVVAQHSCGQSPIPVLASQNSTDGQEKGPAARDQSPASQVPPGFKFMRRCREGSGKSYIVFEGLCTCGTKRTMDRRGNMDQFLDKHRGHNELWAHLSSSDFQWTAGGERRQAEGRPVVRRIPGDLGPLWKRARAGEWTLLSNPMTWHATALKAVSNFHGTQPAEATTSNVPHVVSDEGVPANHSKDMTSLCE